MLIFSSSNELVGRYLIYFCWNGSLFVNWATFNMYENTKLIQMLATAELLTRTPIRDENTTFASAASSTANCFRILCSGSIVVSQSCAGIISPKPTVKECLVYFQNWTIIWQLPNSINSIVVLWKNRTFITESEEQKQPDQFYTASKLERLTHSFCNIPPLRLGSFVRFILFWLA